MKILKAALLTIIAATTIAAQKEGNVTVEANVPVKVMIISAGPGWSISLNSTTPTLETVPVGNYTVRLEFPDGTTVDRALTVRKHCTTRLDVTYKPPTITMQAPPFIPAPPAVVENPKPEPEFTFKPEPVPTRFDECCGCSRDDLKARLDLFAIQLHQNPTVRGRIIAANDVAILYLVNHRGVDRARLELQTTATNCVELWILP